MNTKTPVYTYDAENHEWLFADGRRLPVVSGGSDESETITVPVSGGEEGGAPTHEPQPTPSRQKEGEEYFTKEDLARARQQEKDKLYGRLEKTEAQLAEFQRQQEEEERRRKEALAEEDAKRRAAEEEELSAKDLLARRDQEWEQRLNEATAEWKSQAERLEQDLAARDAMLEQERKLQELNSYTNRRLQEEADEIMPELADLIRGNSEDEIEAAISDAKVRSSAILSNMQRVAEAAQPQRPRPIAPVGASTGGPMDNDAGTKTYTVDDIRNMPLSEWAKHRDAILGASSQLRRQGA